jgi:hypothetical protein
MSDERSRGVPESVKGCAILLIAIGIFAAGTSYAYVAITTKLDADRIKAEKVKKEEEEMRRWNLR